MRVCGKVLPDYRVIIAFNSFMSVTTLAAKKQTLKRMFWCHLFSYEMSFYLPIQWNKSF